MNTEEIKIPEKAAQATKLMTEICLGYEKQIEDLKKENEFFNSFSPGEEIIKYQAENDRSHNPGNQCWSNFEPKHLETGWYNNNTPDFIKNGWTVEKCQKYIQEGEEISKKNQEIIKRNQDKYNKIYNLFKRLGLRETKSVVDTKSRARYTKHITVSTGITEELGRLFPRYDNWPTLKSSYERFIEHIKKYDQMKESHLVQEKAKQDAENKKKELIVFLAELNGKYKLLIPTDSLETWTIRDALLRKNKYLYLAHYLEKNRGDWNDGSSYAENGLNFFIGQKTEELKGVNDSAIYDDIQRHITDWDGDGRCFRDTTYNYDYLFSIVKENNPELYDDYTKLSNLSPEEY